MHSRESPRSSIKEKYRNKKQKHYYGRSLSAARILTFAMAYPCLRKLSESSRLPQVARATDVLKIPEDPAAQIKKNYSDRIALTTDGDFRLLMWETQNAWVCKQPNCILWSRVLSLLTSPVRMKMLLRGELIWWSVVPFEGYSYSKKELVW